MQEQEVKLKHALIIANGTSCSPELLDSLLSEKPFVVVLDKAIYRVLDLGIKIDLWSGDFDEPYDIEAIRERQSSFEIVNTPDQELPDICKAVQLLIDRGFSSVDIIWATGRRADHEIANITYLVLYKNQINIVMLDDYTRIYQLTDTFEKWYAAETIISLIPIGEVEGIQTDGFKENLKNGSLKLGYLSGHRHTTNKDGMVKISAKKGDLLIMESRA